MGGGATLADRELLTAVRAGLATPFVDPVKVAGLEMSRALARSIERSLCRELRAHNPPSPALPRDEARTQRANDLPVSPAGGEPMAGTPLFGRHPSRPVLLDNIPHHDRSYARDIIAAAKGTSEEFSR